MILVEANILLCASNGAADLHGRSRDWLDEKLNGAAPVGLPWQSLPAFLRIATNPRAFRTPLTIAAAWEQVSTWLSAETVWTPEPTERQAAVLGKLLALPRVYGNLVLDTHLAALAIEHGSRCARQMRLRALPGACLVQSARFVSTGRAGPTAAEARSRHRGC